MMKLKRTATVRLERGRDRCPESLLVEYPFGYRGNLARNVFLTTSSQGVTSAESADPIRVVVGEGNYLVREGIRRAPAAGGPIHAVGRAGRRSRFTPGAHRAGEAARGGDGPAVAARGPRRGHRA